MPGGDLKNGFRGRPFWSDVQGTPNGTECPKKPRQFARHRTMNRREVPVSLEIAGTNPEISMDAVRRFLMMETKR